MNKLYLRKLASDSLVKVRPYLITDKYLVHQGMTSNEMSRNNLYGCAYS